MTSVRLRLIDQCNVLRSPT